MHTQIILRRLGDGYIVDRVFAREVDDVIAEHPSVAQVCVIGTPGGARPVLVRRSTFRRLKSAASSGGVGR